MQTIYIMDFILIIVGFVVVAALYLLYTYFANQPLTTGLVKLDATAPMNIAYDKLINPGSSSYHYEGWVFISAGNPVIFYRGAAATPDLLLDINSGKLRIRASNNSGVVETIMHIDNFPKQKWMYIVVNVINSKTVELYLNGKLIQTVEAKFPIKNTKTSPLVVATGDAAAVNSYLTRFFRTDKLLSPDDVWSSYIKGNGVSSALSNFIKYNMRLSVTKGDELVKELKLIPV